jgi:Cu-Zn family superoxide dismutase
MYPERAMKTIATVIAAAVLCVVPVAAKMKAPKITVQLKDAKGMSVGTAAITSAATGGVAIKLNVKDLPEGEHAIHIHSIPKCDGPDFKPARISTRIKSATDWKTPQATTRATC